jgi:hypothetical protein
MVGDNHGFASAAEAALWAEHDRRITRLEEGLVAMTGEVHKIGTEIHRNNELTAKVANDTKEIRDAIAGAKVFGKFAAWGGGVTSFVVTLYALVQLIKGA